MKFLSVLEEVLRIAAIMAILLIGLVQLLILLKHNIKTSLLMSRRMSAKVAESGSSALNNE
jgi:hypothetical protein